MSHHLVVVKIHLLLGLLIHGVCLELISKLYKSFAGPLKIDIGRSTIASAEHPLMEEHPLPMHWFFGPAIHSLVLMVLYLRTVAYTCPDFANFTAVTLDSVGVQVASLLRILV